MVVEHLEARGAGALQVAFEQLKKKLAAEGLFDVARKRPLPLLPRRIGIVTSPRGAVIADMVHILTRRFPGLHLRLYPVRVQGEEAGDICEAIKYFYVRVDALFYEHSGLSTSGRTRLLFAGAQSNRRAWSLGLDANQGKVTAQLQPLTQSDAAGWALKLTPDGKKFVFASLQFRSGKTDIWLHDLETTGNLWMSEF